MRKRSTGLLPFSAESGGERVICPDRAGLEKIEIGDPKGGKNGWIRCTARGMLIAGTFKGTSQIRETQAVQGVRALLKEVPLSPPRGSEEPLETGALLFFRTVREGSRGRMPSVEGSCHQSDSGCAGYCCTNWWVDLVRLCPDSLPIVSVDAYGQCH